jgi:hypothetical protein
LPIAFGDTLAGEGDAGRFFHRVYMPHESTES